MYILYSYIVKIYRKRSEDFTKYTTEKHFHIKGFFLYWYVTYINIYTIYLDADRGAQCCILILDITKKVEDKNASLKLKFLNNKVARYSSTNLKISPEVFMFLTFPLEENCSGMVRLV